MKTFDETVKLLRQAVELRGEDYVYPREWKDERDMCMYVRPDGKGPACIVGLVAHKAGVDLNTLRVFEGSTADTLGQWLGFDGQATRLLYWTQTAQDASFPWGEAVERGIQAAKEEEWPED